jgi:hypothetical protein
MTLMRSAVIRKNTRAVMVKLMKRRSGPPERAIFTTRKAF